MLNFHNLNFEEIGKLFLVSIKITHNQYIIRLDYSLVLSAKPELNLVSITYCDAITHYTLSVLK